MATASFMTVDMPLSGGLAGANGGHATTTATTTSSNNSTAAATVNTPPAPTSPATAAVVTSTTVTASSDASTTKQVLLSSQSHIQPSIDASIQSTEEVQVSSDSTVSVAKVIFPSQVVVAHSFPEHQQSQQQSVLFQALTSHPTSHFIALVPGQENERLDLQSSQPVPCVQYIDEGGGSNVFSTPNGHMTAYSVYTPTEQPNMYTPSSAAYYNTTQEPENYSQVVNESAESVENHAFSDQQDVFQLDENSSVDHEGSQLACYPSSRQSAATMKWLIDNYEMADGMSVPRSTMYSHYLKHCNEAKMEPLNAASFGKLIRSVFTGLRTRRLGTRGNSKYHYYGIRLKASSSINKTADSIVSSTFRQNPFVHMRRIKSEQVKMDDSDNGEEVEPDEVNERSNGRNLSSPEKHQIYLGDASTAIPAVDVEFDVFSLPEGITMEHVTLFKNSYRKHCEAFLEAVINFRFGVVETLWYAFWNQPENDQSPGNEPSLNMSTLLALCMWKPIQEFVKHTDYQFYQNLVEVLIPEVLRPIPSTLTQAIRTFAKSLEGWLKAAMVECCSDIVNIKISAISAFAQTLRRYTSLNHLAQAARAVLQSTTQIKQMTTDLSRVDFHSLQEQASWVCQCEDETVQRLLDEFRQTLQHHLWLEEWASWLETIVESALAPYKGKPNYPKAARHFLLKWSFYSSLVIRDLTLRSAASFGSFHLLRLLYDEYMFFIIEHCIAQATGTTTIAVMGEYLCSGKPEQLCGNSESKKRKLGHTTNLESKEINHLQNGSIKENTEPPSHSCNSNNC